MLAALLANPMVAVVAYVPDVVLDIRYATPSNPTGKPLYPFPAAFLRRSTAVKLKTAADVLRAKGFRLVVYDAYRPLASQKALWAAKPDPLYVADPKKGSAHNKGAAVDVALADPAGEPLAMPSPFDDFGPKAHHGADGVPADARERAATLKTAMEAAGFVALPEEWWHYRDASCGSWPLLDVPLEELR